ncbi:MAG: hypothetical protein JWO35_736 [Candidatus Saccharibacteria bacterium]|nr:hypothetical protein [Candidatus Saccharibacteria bacterium]
MTTSKQHFRPGRRQLLAFAVLLLMAVVLLPQLSGFNESLHLLRNPNWLYATLAFILAVLTYFAAAATYCFLAFKPLPYYRTLLAQFAAMFINRLLPAGFGALGVNYAYLHKMRHSPVQAATVVSVNNLFGLLGHMLLLGVLALFFHASVPSFTARGIGDSASLVAGAVALIIACSLLFAPKLRRKAATAFADIVKQLGKYRGRPSHLLAALTSSTTLTFCNILSLYVCLLGFGVHLSFVAVALVFTIGIGAGTATPTPGGLGGLEAGMVAGFIAYGVPSAAALAAVILYRVFSYWLMLAIGAVAFAFCQRRGYFRLA